ncbi:MAG: hypothetical protein ACTSX4_01155 [Candidatus Helarchaeota archaeon]
MNFLTRFCKSFCEIIDKYVKYIVVSGFLVISSGRSRATEDIDIIIEPINQQDFIKMHEELERQGFECLQSSNPLEIHEYLQEKLPVRYIKNDNLIPNIEMKFVKDQLDYYQIKTRSKIEFTGLDVYFGSIEACIAFKEDLLKSPKDMADAEHLRIVYSEQIKEEEINKIKKMIKKYRL